MKKFFALFLALCLMMPTLSALAESGEDKTSSGLAGLLSGFLGDNGINEEEISQLLNLVSGLKEKFKGKDAKILAIQSAVKSKLAKMLGTDEDSLGSMLSGLKEMLKGTLSSGKDFDLEGILGNLFGLGDTFELSEEDIAELDKVFEENNQKSLAETGDRAPNKKEAESIDEFYGDWILSKYVASDDQFDLSDSGMGIFLGENTYYYTMDGELSADDGVPPEVLETKFEYGVLKILVNKLWYVFVLTQDGELVETDSDSLSYYVRPAK